MQLCSGTFRGRTLAHRSLTSYPATVAASNACNDAPLALTEYTGNPSCPPGLHRPRMMYMPDLHVVCMRRLSGAWCSSTNDLPQPTMRSYKVESHRSIPFAYIVLQDRYILGMVGQRSAISLSISFQLVWSCRRPWDLLSALSLLCMLCRYCAALLIHLDADSIAPSAFE